MTGRIDMTGQRFGRLTVTEFAFTKHYGGSGRHTHWRCQCDCGEQTIVSRTNLMNGSVASCGCVRFANNAANATRHGHKRGSGSPTYKSWYAMRQRCNDPNQIGYAKYGGRGVTVCERWSQFENFLADMGTRPPGHTLDRFPDPAGNYEPSNCRWATPLQQRHNRRPKEQT